MPPARSVLRLTTIGAVDDGKSSLLGRLLLDADAVFEDHLLSLPRDGAGVLDGALLFDGLEAEREQGITIDVAYRYFETQSRKFILADAPGHEAHTRNMATAASQADLAIIVVDGLRGPSAQTFRHLHIARLVGIKIAILAVSKMDLCGFGAERFDAVRAPIAARCAELGIHLAAVIPVSAKTGANIVHAGVQTPWHTGPSLLRALEAITPALMQGPFRFPVQLVVKPEAGLGGRGYAGAVTSGSVQCGDTVLIPHWGTSARVARIASADGDRAVAHAGAAVTLVLEGEHDIARGDVIAAIDPAPAMTSQIEADVIGLGDTGLRLGRTYELRCATRTVAASITQFGARTDFGVAPRDADGLGPNEIAQARIALARPIPLDLFDHARDTGGFLLVDRHSGETLACGMIRAMAPSNVQARPQAITPTRRAALMGHKPGVIWFTGLSGAGKSTIAELVERALCARGVHTFALDGDNLRSGLTKDLGFSPADRVENIRRAGEVARLFADAGLIVTCAFVSPFQADRALVRDLVGADRFLEVFIDAPLDVCMARDPKGLYRRALAGEIKDFSGVSSPYEPPGAPDLHIHAGAGAAETHAEAVIALLIRRGMIG
jgi:bifunctional enzyme CysN/CysC